MIEKYAVILTGGYSPRKELVKQYTEHAEYIIAADSGFDIAVDYGIEVDFLVGDMDSVRSDAGMKELPEEKKLIVSHEKDETDTELAIEKSWEEGYRDIVLIGGGGGRLDHIIGILWLFEREKHPLIWVTDAETVTAVKKNITFRAEPGERISLFPISDRVEGLHSEGLKWSLAGLDWKRGDLGLSNVAAESSVSIQLTGGKLLMIRENRVGVSYV